MSGISVRRAIEQIVVNGDEITTSQLENYTLHTRVASLSRASMEMGDKQESNPGIIVTNEKSRVSLNPVDFIVGLPPTRIDGSPACQSSYISHLGQHLSMKDFPEFGPAYDCLLAGLRCKLGLLDLLRSCITILALDHTLFVCRDVGCFSHEGVYVHDLVRMENAHSQKQGGLQLLDVSLHLAMVICKHYNRVNPSLMCLCCTNREFTLGDQSSLSQLWCPLASFCSQNFSAYNKSACCLGHSICAEYEAQGTKWSMNCWSVLGMSRCLLSSPSVVYTMRAKLAAHLHMANPTERLLTGLPNDTNSLLALSTGQICHLQTRLTNGRTVFTKRQGEERQMVPIKSNPMSLDGSKLTVKSDLTGSLSPCVVDMAYIMQEPHWSLTPYGEKYADIAVPYMGCSISTNAECYLLKVLISKEGKSSQVATVYHGPVFPFFKTGVPIRVDVDLVPNYLETSKLSPLVGFDYVATSGNFSYINDTVPALSLALPSGFYFRTANKRGSVCRFEQVRNCSIQLLRVHHTKSQAYLSVGSMSDSIVSDSFPIKSNQVGSWVPLKCDKIELTQSELPITLDDAMYDPQQKCFMFQWDLEMIQGSFDNFVSEVDCLSRLIRRFIEPSTFQSIIRCLYAVGELAICDWSCRELLDKCRTGSIFTLRIPDKLSQLKSLTKCVLPNFDAVDSSTQFIVPKCIEV